MEVKLSNALEILKAAAAAGILGKDKDFVESLMKAATKSKYGLSPKQEVWFFKMAEKYSGGKPAAAPAPVLSSIGEFSGVYSLFAKAKEKLKFPKINLMLASGSPVVLHLAGPKSVKPGVVNVTNGGKYKAPDSKWYGRVNVDGSMELGGASNGAEFAEVKAVLAELAAAPAKVAAAHAKLTGRCCFCNKHLTDADHSTAVGFGPVCAKNFGLYAEWKSGVSLFEALAKEAGGSVPELVAADAALELSGLDEAALKTVGLKKIPIESATEIAAKHYADVKANFNFDKATAKPAVVAVPEPKKDQDYLF
jgi:Family of unknown function (DUF6011)